MDKIPFEWQGVIHELVEFWQTHYEPCDLVTHIDKLSGIWRSDIDVSFFRQVYEDLRTDKHGNYAACSASEFKQLLEAKCHRAQSKEKASFFQQRYEDLRKHGNYAACSASEIKQIIEAEYCQAQVKAEADRQARMKVEADRQTRAKAEADRQAQAKAEADRQTKEREEYETGARADFDALGKEMAKATTRAERVELGRKRAVLAPYTGVSYVYVSHCWNCKKPISSDINAQCLDCRYYICSSCSSCFC